MCLCLDTDEYICMGRHCVNRISIPRFTISPSDNNLPFALRRRPFPVPAAFAMIDKSQRQPLNQVGRFLRG